MNLSEQEIQSIVSEATATLKAQLSADLTNKLSAEVNHAAIGMVRDHVKEWVKENVLPDVSAILTTGKASLVNAAAGAAETMCVELAKAMNESLKENLEKSWDRKKIFDAMFR